MSDLSDFGEIQAVDVIFVVDNRADLIEKSTDTVKRFTNGPLLAEHGFSVLIDLHPSEVRILWDAGISRTTALENLNRMGIEPSSIDKIAISHGHGDHTRGVTDILKAMDVKPEFQEWDHDATPDELREWGAWRKVPLVAHPGAFRERWSFPKDEKKSGPYLPPPQEEWKAVGADVILSEDPYQLDPGCWTTGAVPRRSFEKSGWSSSMVYLEGDSIIQDTIEEDQTIVINVKEKGLVVVSGCAHSGIVNTVNYAREVSGVNEIWAILGGFHLGRSTDEEIQLSVDAVKAFKPKMIVPSHCTGFKAMCQFAEKMPDEFVLGLVGTKFSF